MCSRLCLGLSCRPYFEVETNKTTGQQFVVLRRMYIQERHQKPNKYKIESAGGNFRRRTHNAATSPTSLNTQVKHLTPFRASRSALLDVVGVVCNAGGERLLWHRLRAEQNWLKHTKHTNNFGRIMSYVGHKIVRLCVNKARFSLTCLRERVICRSHRGFGLFRSSRRIAEGCGGTTGAPQSWVPASVQTLRHEAPFPLPYFCCVCFCFYIIAPLLLL